MLQASTLWASGLEVGPASFSWQEVRPGRPAAARLIRITNRSALPRTYTVRLKPPAQKISSMVSIDPAEITLTAGSTGTIKLVLAVPDQPGNYGQAWRSHLEVREKPQPGQSIFLACYPKVYITTQDQ